MSTSIEHTERSLNANMQNCTSPVHLLIITSAYVRRYYFLCYIENYYISKLCFSSKYVLNNLKNKTTVESLFIS